MNLKVKKITITVSVILFAVSTIVLASTLTEQSELAPGVPSLPLQGTLFRGAPLATESSLSLLTLWFSLLAGLISGLTTFYFSWQMRGSRVGGILNLLGAGIVSTFIGFYFMSSYTPAYIWWVETIWRLGKFPAYIIGCTLILLGISRIKSLEVGE